MAVGFKTGMAALLLVGAGVGFYVWWNWPQPSAVCDLSLYETASRDAMLVPEDPLDGPVDKVVYLDQGWQPRDSMDFYTRTQGSRLLPYAWFLALEEADSSARFADSKNMNRYRYLPQNPNACNPDGLPVGFVKDPKREGGKTDWLGLTCAACHTAQLHYEKTAYRIDGGPTLADHDAFLKDLTRALTQTVADTARFERFAQQVSKLEKQEQDRQKLKADLKSIADFRTAYAARNQTPVEYGYGRLDAFGRIVNEVLVRHIDVKDADQPKPPNAPVSYPFLWDTPHHDVVQWNGIARNTIPGGPLARNVGEVLGVFGEVQIPDDKLAVGFPSSVRAGDLNTLEDTVRKLQSPLWPKEFPAIDPVQRDLGAKLFKDHCNKCHDHDKFRRDDPDRKIKAELTKIKGLGTDKMMAENFAFRSGKTGKMQGRLLGLFPPKFFEEEEPADAILVAVVARTILGSASGQYKESDLLNHRTVSPFKVFDADLVYKTRPLNGIWATAPYLHNGSVPNLYELLLPAKERSTEFLVGSREFDPKHVGLRTKGYKGFVFRTQHPDKKDAALPGNSNAGHEYATDVLKDEQRWQLVEYMKSL